MGICNILSCIPDIIDENKKFFYGNYFIKIKTNNKPIIHGKDYVILKENMSQIHKSLLWDAHLITLRLFCNHSNCNHSNHCNASLVLCFSAAFFSSLRFFQKLK